MFVGPASPQTMTIVATVAAAGPQTNTATIVALDQVDPDTTNNSASASLVPGRADLALSKTVDQPSPDLGDQVTFTVTLTDGGPATATGVTVLDALPAGLTFVAATPSQGTHRADAVRSETGRMDLSVLRSGDSV